MSGRERMIERLQAVQALAERGDAGEKKSAAAMLEKLLEKYGISETEISEERRELVWFRYKTPLEKKLLNQVIYSITGHSGYGCVGAESGRKRKKLGIECTAAERLEIEFSFEFFWKAMEKELNNFYLAFLYKNNIFPKTETEAGEAAEVTTEEAAHIQILMAGMGEYHCRKLLESGQERGGQKCRK